MILTRFQAILQYKATPVLRNIGNLREAFVQKWTDQGHGWAKKDNITKNILICVILTHFSDFITFPRIDATSLRWLSLKQVCVLLIELSTADKSSKFRRHLIIVITLLTNNARKYFFIDLQNISFDNLINILFATMGLWISN